MSTQLAWLARASIGSPALKNRSSLTHRSLLTSFYNASSCMHRPFPSTGAAYATAASTSNGQNLHAFKLVESRFLKDYDCEAKVFKHTRTGADWVHLEKPDTNNVFMVGFQTAVSDSTGVPHILEHTTLCGSNRYPVRDPFFKMLNRSMATFMNALTGDDFTVYPFSSENKSDYFNLMDVYLDSVFAPRLRKLDFMQEGWRLEHENPKDISTPIIFKGVVYNEMKGALADTSSLFQTRHQQVLYPGSTYEYVSGGDPENITDLTHEQLLAFHSKNYHPSNARFYSYGSFPLDEQMQRVDEKLSTFSSLPRHSLDDVPRWTEPRTIRAVGPLDPMGDSSRQSRVAVSYLTNSEKDLQKSLSMKILVNLLTDGASSPMYKALIESGLGTDYAATTGHSQFANRASTSFSLQGMASKDIPVAIESIQYILEEAAKTGFPKDRINNILHQIELGLKHRTASFGMNLGLNLIRTMIHGSNPLDAIDTAPSLIQLRSDLAQPGFLESCIESSFLKNPHRLTYIMEPDAGYPLSLVEKESKRLARHVSALSEKDIDTIRKDGIELLKLQETKEDLGCLPCLPLSDVSRDAKFYPLRTTTLDSGLKQHWRETQTNGVSYVYLKWDVTDLSDREKLLAPLMCSSLTSLGTESKSLGELDEAIREHTAGVSASVFTSPSVTGERPRDYMIVSASALDRNLAAMYAIVLEVLQTTHWAAHDNLKIALLSMASSSANSIPDSGHAYAIKSAAAALKSTCYSSELFGGMRQIEFLDELSRQSESLSELSIELGALANKVLRSTTPEILVVSDPHVVDQHSSLHKTTLASLAISDLSLSASSVPLTSFVPMYETKNFPMDLGINFTARSFSTVPYSHPDAAALKILASLMSTHFLHRELREKGGAYGGGAQYNALDGVLSFMTYRDPPGAQRTLATYSKSIDWACDITQHVGASDLEQAKLEAFRNMDKPVDAAGEGLTLFQYGLELSPLQAHRDALFAVTLQDVEQVAKKYLQTSSATCVIGEKLPSESE
ncbi:hypothetical protein BASA50_002312 [Batrachochytrium salamandrivorans]|uniref:Presequence protease, mitochondrial n=1 Tax=Batrachochytrium salamandrivorans TaxID=1357716 RepID=A0ABQ8FLN3_9FUNG|nr:hypothetical protein BASA60_004520 [Batrachochytrium salamandrivorans]KAH6600414.1 hypothetical protein BASA50_002312 [Batrachochytrium salamandrivorans]KAH9257455.1 hypothetical protein BASA81_004381 [Batrachochytrium salamandrivorans]KAH9276718.1 hypothetical protein BASA83_000852 [Batrachochytrium salamandrivorans]